MKRIWPGVAGAAALAVLVVTLWGLYLPEAVESTARATLPVSVNNVWAVLGEPESRARWWGDVERVERADGTEPTRLEWTEHYSGGSHRSFRRTNYFPPRAQSYVASPKRGVIDEWTYQVLPGEDGARVALTRNRIVRNPAFRFFYHFFADPTVEGEQKIEALGEQAQK